MCSEGIRQTAVVTTPIASAGANRFRVWTVVFPPQVDCTITYNDGLDLLAEFMGVKDEVEELTNKVGRCLPAFSF